jgi:hypothetical protein
MSKKHPSNKDFIQVRNFPPYQPDQALLVVENNVLRSIKALEESVNRNIEKNITATLGGGENPVISAEFKLGGAHSFSLPIEGLREHPEAFEKYEKQILELLRLVRERVPATKSPVRFKMGIRRSAQTGSGSATAFVEETPLGMSVRFVPPLPQRIWEGTDAFCFLRYQIDEFEKIVTIHHAAKSGGKSIKGGYMGGIIRGRQQTTSREEDWAKWQAEAEKIWKKRPTWGRLRVAKEVHKRYSDYAVDTIRKRIKKPTP